MRPPPRSLRSIAALFFASGMLLASFASASAQTRIEPGDKLQLTVFNHPDLSSEMTVTSSGEVRVPIAGEVAVEGLSQEMASARVQKALGPFLFHPSIDLRVLSQGQSIFFTGSLVGVQPFSPGETLGAAIGQFRQALSIQQAAASVTGATLNSIDLRRVRIERSKHALPEVDLEAVERSGDAGPRLEPGDTVLLSSKPIRVDVRGNLNIPTAVYVYPGDTLAQAVAEVGPYSANTSLTSIGLRRDGVDSVVTSAGGAFTAPAHDGDVVTLEPAPHVSVLGMVEKPGDATLQARPTLLNALYEAGGPNRFADLGRVQITHDGQSRILDISRLTHGDMSQNTTVHDGDVIFVPEGHKIDFSAFSNALGALSSLKYLGGI
jgi:polysaccharide export outer membrane protein